jgi:hypothetical protein
VEVAKKKTAGGEGAQAGAGDCRALKRVTPAGQEVSRGGVFSRESQSEVH